jgi:hypothetical protein
MTYGGWVRKVVDSDGDGTADSSTIFVHDGAETSPLPHAGEASGVTAARIVLQFEHPESGNAVAGQLSPRGESIGGIGDAGIRPWQNQRWATWTGPTPPSWVVSEWWDEDP